MNYTYMQVQPNFLFELFVTDRTDVPFVKVLGSLMLDDLTPLRIIFVADLTCVPDISINMTVLHVTFKQNHLILSKPAEITNQASILNDLLLPMH